MTDRRFGSGFGSTPTSEPGLVLEDDDVVYIVKPDGTREAAGGGGGGGSQIVSQTTVILSDAQIKALPTTPVQLIADPGAGKVLLPFAGSARLNWTGDYSNIDPAAQIGFGPGRFHTGQFAPIEETTFGDVTNFLANSSATWAFLTISNRPNGSNEATDAGWTDAIVIGPLVIWGINGPAGDFTGGDPANSVTLNILYTVIDL